eukprot:288381-Pleurochrysis_carterae.AAC.1
MPIIPATTAMAYSALPARSTGISRMVVVDSGCTRKASGDRRLFFADRITQRKPNMRVKVANGVTLPVEFIGSIILRIPAGDVRNNNGVTVLDRRDHARAARCALCPWPVRYLAVDEGNVPEARHPHIPQRRASSSAFERPSRPHPRNFRQLRRHALV